MLITVAAAVLVAAVLCGTIIPVLVLRRQRFDNHITASHCAEGDCWIDVSKLFFGDEYAAETITFQLTATGGQLSCGRQQLGASTHSPTPTHWFGLCHGGGNAILMQKAGRKKNERLIHGSVVDAANNLICQLSPNAEGINRVVCTPNTEFPPETDPVEDDSDEFKRFLYHQQASFTAKRQQVVNNRNSTTSFGHQRDLMTERCAGYLDIMVGWTARAECRNSKLPAGCTLTAATERNMRGLIDLVIAETNTAFQASGISSATVRLVHAYREPRYVEPSTNAYSTTLEALRFIDGVMDDVHTKRSEVRSHFFRSKSAPMQSVRSHISSDL